MSWQIDPRTGDFVMTQGQPVDDASLKFPAYYRLKITRGKWLHAPDSLYGSDFGNLSKKFSSKDATGLSNIGKQALQPMIDDGRALAVDVQPDTSQPLLRNNGAISVVITSAEGVTDTLQLPPVGD